MYIAFKWLVTLALVMWLVMCFVDIFSKENMKTCNTGLVSKSLDDYENKSVNIQLFPVTSEVNNKETLQSYYHKYQNRFSIHFLMFIAGAVVVTVFHKKQDLVTFVYKKIPTINMVVIQGLFNHSKLAATIFKAAIVKKTLCMREKIKIVLLNIHNKICDKISSLKKAPVVKQNKIHVILLKKLKEITEERKNLGQLLISALRENKNIRMRYELETMTKNRLMQHIEDTQKQVKENRSKYVSFQQSYLLTHQENIYLKARLVKLKQEKEETEKDLMGLVNEVYMSKNKVLKTYCTRFLVKTKNNLLSSDVGAEIKEFLENSRKKSQIRITPKVQLNKPKIPSSTSIQITEIVNQEDCLVSLATDAPKLRGLPGEYVWTVKDKDGMIEKLYEYDFDSDFDSWDTIRRIRQYSVYFDKDCLLDFGRREDESNMVSCSTQLSSTMSRTLTSKKIVTGSEVFQNFLKNTNSIVQIKPNSSH